MSEFSQTTAYRKLQALSDAGLVREDTEIRSDGHHVNTYERSITGVAVMFEEDGEIELELGTVRQPADHQLAQFWSRMSEEL
ncbi:hypothetical protein AUR64_14460 [Haloprofundus marisrubri]|uniref:Transcriptional regulator n=2 Tax=Haloprofundus marisrubri TaxID=1514971 RepID=A0A0W1R729_9EURY|nr:hypothetical protein AUR64_14460 [Haloprofundus marisrubri]